MFFENHLFSFFLYFSFCLEKYHNYPWVLFRKPKTMVVLFSFSQQVFLLLKLIMLNRNDINDLAHELRKDFNLQILGDLEISDLRHQSYGPFT